MFVDIRCNLLPLCSERATKVLSLHTNSALNRNVCHSKVRKIKVKLVFYLNQDGRGYEHMYTPKPSASGVGGGRPLVILFAFDEMRFLTFSKLKVED